MINFLAIFRNKKVLIFITSIVLILIFAIYLSNNSKKIDNTITTTGEQWNGIIPGKSSKEDIIKNLGEPIRTSDNSLSFKSTSEARNNEVTLTNNKADLIRQMVTPQGNITTETYTKKYGDTSIILYGPDSPNGINLYVYTDKGFAYLGNPLTNGVIEAWYFPPTTLEIFKTRYAQEYSDTYGPSF